LYQNGSLDAGDQERVEQLENLAAELDTIGGKLNRQFRFEVMAHPLIGANREANRRVETRRAEQVRDRLIASGVPANRIEARPSDDLALAGEGVSLVAKEIEVETTEQ
jgi:hypothetical protein